MKTTEPTAASGMTLGARLLGILFSPRPTFEQVVRDPKWVSILAFSIVLVSVGAATFLGTEVGQQALLEQQAQSAARFGTEINDEQRAQLERFVTYAPYFTATYLLVTLPIVSVVVAGLLYLGVSGLLGAAVTFRQLFAIVAHASVVFVVQQGFVTPLNYARESMSNPATLAAFVPMLDPDTFVVRFLNVIDLFYVWWIMLLSIGLAVACRRRTTPIAATLYTIYGAVAVVIAVVLTRLAG